VSLRLAAGKALLQMLVTLADIKHQIAMNFLGMLTLANFSQIRSDFIAIDIGFSSDFIAIPTGLYCG